MLLTAVNNTHLLFLIHPTKKQNNLLLFVINLNYKTMNKQQFFITPFIGSVIIALIIIYGSLSPDTGGSGILEVLGLDFQHSDKVLHGGFYFLLAVSIYYGFIRQKRRFSTHLIHLYSIMLPVLLGGVIEIIQWKLIQTRHGEFADMGGNIIGILLALLGYTIYKRHFQGKKIKSW